MRTSYTAQNLQQVKAFALGKLVEIQHCPRNGINEKTYHFKSLDFTSLHFHYVGRWVCQYCESIFIFKSGYLLVVPNHSIIHVG